MINKYINRSLTLFLIAIMLVYTLTGCANMPTAYGQYVEITSGIYKGERGRLVGDCSGFERYKVNIGYNVCIRSWNMEKIF